MKIIVKFLMNLCTSDGYKKLVRLIEQLDSQPEDQRFLWIPGGLTAISNDHNEFQAEATLSGFELDKNFFYTLILRDVNDRLEAEQKIYSLTAEAEYLKSEIKALHNFDEIIGQSKPILHLLREVEQVAATDTTVFILGETGTGKELIARAIHNSSRRKQKPLIKVNCATIPATLIESEFSDMRRAFCSGGWRLDLSRRNWRITARIASQAPACATGR